MGPRTGPAADRGPAGRAAPTRAPPTIGVVSPSPPPDPPAVAAGAGAAGGSGAGAGHVHDVLVVGGGPSGSSCAYWLAEAGWDVALVEKKVFPREKTCGDGLTPRSVRQIADMGIEGALAGAHRFIGPAGPRLRPGPRPALARAPELSLLRLRDHPARPRRHRQRAGGQGRGHRVAGHRGRRADPGGDRRRPGGTARGPATAMLPSCVGAVVKDKATGATRPVRARYVVVADGANSRFGRALGTARDRNQPMGMALRGYYPHPATTSRSSSPTWTSGTTTARWSPATAGSSRWATGGSTSGWACSPPTSAGRGSTPRR